MAPHYLLSSKSKNINLKDILRLTEEDAFHDLHSERHLNLCGKLVNFRILCNCYIIIPLFFTALFILRSVAITPFFILRAIMSSRIDKIFEEDKDDEGGMFPTLTIPTS